MLETASVWTRQASPFEADGYESDGDSEQPVTKIDPLGDLMAVFFAATSFRSAIQPPSPEPKDDKGIVSSLEQMLTSCYEQYNAVTGRDIASSSKSSKKKNNSCHDSSRVKAVVSDLGNSSSSTDLLEERQNSLHPSNTGRSFDTANSRHSPSPTRRQQRRVAVAVLDTLRDPQGRQVVITPSRARRQRLYSSGDALHNARSFESKQDNIPVSISWTR